ncbi:MAG: hypothetical protein ACREFV_07720 [Acetobacteraceae bacterium]
MRRVAALIAFLVFVPAVARAAPVALKLTYVTYAAGFTTVKMTAILNLTNEGYRLAVDYHTLGMIGLLFPGHAREVADGTWQGTRAAPESFQSLSTWSGRTFDVRMAYADGLPRIMTLEPAETRKREIVPAALRAGTVDTLSAMALLIERMADGKGCRMALHAFDGRRLMALSAEPAGSQRLGVTTRSFFHGTAARCDVRGKMLAGFLRSDGPAERAHIDRGAAWFAHPIPGVPVLPVRISFSTKWFGAATMYLTNIEAAPAPQGLKRVALSPAAPMSQEGQAQH